MAPVKHLTVYGPWCHCVVSTETCIINLAIVCASMITGNVQKLLLNHFNHLLSLAIKSVLLIAPGHCGWFNCWIAGGMWIRCRVCAWNNYLLSSLQIVLKKEHRDFCKAVLKAGQVLCMLIMHVMFGFCCACLILYMCSPFPSVVFQIMRKKITGKD